MTVDDQKNRDPKNSNRRQLDHELDRLESHIAELRVLYEQHFVDILPQPPTKQHKEAVVMIRKLLKAPFKNSATRFRLRTLVSRYQTYATYWERVLKEKEEGKYSRDVFKAEIREKAQEAAKQSVSSSAKVDRGMKQLFDSYETALRKNGQSTNNLNFDAFKKSLMNKAKQLKDQLGTKKLHYKVVVKDGKVTVKASAK